MPHHYTSLADLETMYDHIYLSPHLDDVALSCGGSIARFIAAEQSVLVVNICSGSPAPTLALSPFAQHHHAQWRLDPDSAVSQRVQEDVAAMETLGADCLQLDQLDAIYRLPDAYYDNATLFGAVAPNDPLREGLAGYLRELLARFPNAIFYAPLGIGHHVDHQIAYEVAVGCTHTQISLAFYEDFPYVTVGDALLRRMAELGGATMFMPSVTDIGPTLPRKISAIESYASQIGLLFGDLTTMAQRITAYAEELRPDVGTYGERIWMRR